MKPARLPEGYDATLTPGEVARIFGVDPKTVSRWDKSGKLTGFRTPGGHRRFREADIRAILDSYEDE
jgi:excisionase family DNA binding protein